MKLQDIHFWPLLAGLGLFLFGMHMLEEALKTLAGRSFKLFLRRHTKNRIKAVLAGASVTAVLQSSSMVALLVMSFAGAGIIGLQNGIGMILGANLGTTFTSWLVSLLGFKLNIGAFILPFLAVGGLGIIFLKSDRLANFSKALMGFSFMFLGLSYMKDGFVEFATHVDPSIFQDKALVLFSLAGFVLAASIQSSSASMMIFLSSLSAGIISLTQGAYLAIGADLGTTVTALIGTLGANEIKKKVGWSQFYFNFFTGLLAMILTPALLYIITTWGGIKDTLIALAAFHSLMNLMGIAVFLPFLKTYTQLINRFISSPERGISQYIALSNPAETHAGIAALHSETRAFIRKAIEVNAFAFGQSTENWKMSFENAYSMLKRYESEVTAFYIRLEQNPLNPQEVQQINACVTAIRNTVLSTKDLKDIRHNLGELENATGEPYHNLFHRLCREQLAFYRELLTLLSQIDSIEAEALDVPALWHERFYRDEVQEAYRRFQSTGATEIEVSTQLNLLREIHNSNEYLLRALGHLHAVKHGGAIQAPDPADLLAG